MLSTSTSFSVSLAGEIILLPPSFCSDDEATSDGSKNLPFQCPFLLMKHGMVQIIPCLIFLAATSSVFASASLAVLFCGVFLGEGCV